MCPSLCGLQEAAGQALCSLLGNLTERVQNCFLECRALPCNLPVTLALALLPGQTPGFV